MNLRVVALVCLPLLGCSKKESPSPPTAESTSATASAAAPAPASAASEVANAPPDFVKASSTSEEPVEPNAPPAHEEHSRAAAAEIHKGNYKSELERLEREGVNDKP